MWLMKTAAPWVLLAFLGLQVSLSCGARAKKRGEDQAVTATTATGGGQRSGHKPAASGRGKFSINDTMQCTWGSKSVGDAVRLSVKCQDREARAKGGVTELQCHYIAKPQSCPGYLSNTKGFWKQVARALKRQQGNVCVDERALVRASMCKRAPRDANFKLDIRSSVASDQSGEPKIAKSLPPRPVFNAAPPAGPTAVPTAGPTTACTARANHQKTAEENCGGSWASVCNFFLSILQSEDC